jgi:hypothetical protein
MSESAFPILKDWNPFSLEDTNRPWGTLLRDGDKSFELLCTPVDECLSRKRSHVRVRR